MFIVGSQRLYRTLSAPSYRPFGGVRGRHVLFHIWQRFALHDVSYEAWDQLVKQLTADPAHFIDSMSHIKRAPPFAMARGDPERPCPWCGQEISLGALIFKDGSAWVHAICPIRPPIPVLQEKASS